MAFDYAADMDAILGANHNVGPFDDSAQTRLPRKMGAAPRSPAAAGVAAAEAAAAAAAANVTTIRDTASGDARPRGYSKSASNDFGGSSGGGGGGGSSRSRRHKDGTYLEPEHAEVEDDRNQDEKEGDSEESDSEESDGGGTPEQASSPVEAFTKIQSSGKGAKGKGKGKANARSTTATYELFEKHLGKRASHSA